MSTDAESSNSGKSTCVLQKKDPYAEPLWQLIFVLLWQSLYKISSAAVTVLLKFLALFIGIVGGLYASTPVQKLSKSIPANADAAHKYLWSSCEQSFVT